MPWDPSEDGSDRKQRQSASSHPHSHAGLICLLLSLVLRARLAGLASNTLAPLKDVSSLLAGSTPTSSNHQQVQRLIHTRKSSCSSPTPTDLCSSSTNCFRTTCIARYVRADRYACCALSLIRDGIAGFIVLGPDYFFGIPVQNLPPDRDKVAWSREAFAAAMNVFPTWFEQVKVAHGATPRHRFSPTPC